MIRILEYNSIPGIKDFVILKNTSLERNDKITGN
jgi:hypothetical protein